jgi:hypothetical protein
MLKTNIVADETGRIWCLLCDADLGDMSDIDLAEQYHECESADDPQDRTDLDR